MAIDFDQLNETEVQVELVSISGTRKVEATEGMTIKAFKEANGLVNAKLIDEDSNVLRDGDVVYEGMQIFVSTPKRNG